MHIKLIEESEFFKEEGEVGLDSRFGDEDFGAKIQINIPLIPDP